MLQPDNINFYPQYDLNNEQSPLVEIPNDIVKPTIQNKSIDIDIVNSNAFYQNDKNNVNVHKSNDISVSNHTS